MTLPTRRQTVSFAPISGPSGYSLTGYVWQYDLEEYVDVYGNERVRKVSDWHRSEVAAVTGREIVHQFSVVASDGRDLLVSLESAAKLLGFAKGEVGEKNVKSIASSVKTLAKLRMEKAMVDAQNEALKAKNATHRADLERVTAEYADRQPTVTGKEPAPGFEEWEMDGITCWYCPSKGSAAWMQDDRRSRVESIRRSCIERKMKEMGHTNGMYPASVSYGDLPERIRKQEQKINKMTKDSK